MSSYAYSCNSFDSKKIISLFIKDIWMMSYSKITKVELLNNKKMDLLSCSSS